MQQETLHAEKRAMFGTRASKRLRRSGRVPGIVYGVDVEPTSIDVSQRDLYAALHTEAGLNAIIEVDFDGSSVLTVAREIQRNPVRGDIIHLDFIKVDLDTEIEADVALEFVGVPIGVREDEGIVATLEATVTISALPTAIPSSIEANIENLGMYDSLKVSDLPEIDGVTYVTDPDNPLATVMPPAAEIEEVVVVETDEDGVPIEGAEGDEEASDEDSADGEED